MNIKIDKLNQKIKNHIFIYFSNEELPSKELKNFDKKQLNFEKNEKIKIELFTHYTTDDLHFDLLIKLKNKKLLNQFLENKIIPTIISTIKNKWWDWWLDLDNTLISITEKKLIEELLIQWLYEFNKYKSSKDTKKYSLTIQDSERNNKEFETLKKSIYFTRDLINEPPEAVNPETLEEIIKKRFKSKVKITIIKWKDLPKVGLNWIWYVWKWSEKEPRLIIIEYRPNKKDLFNIWLVWKGVTFDAWGYNIKPTGYMEDMKSDMAWAAVVLWILDYLINTNFNKNIVVAVPLVENLISWKAYKPWDIIKMYNWKTVEIWNTDAEWRLILADALAYIEKNYKPDYIFDFATLTWAQIIALWNKIAAAIWKNENLIKKIQKLSWQMKERVWELPHFDYYFESMKSDIADMNNIAAGKYGPWTITAGLFLSQFVKNKNWVHFDIAWPTGIFKWKDPLYWPGATGFGVRLGINIIKEIL